MIRGSTQQESDIQWKFTFTEVLTDVSISTSKQVKVNIRSIEEPKIFGSRKFPKILKLRSEIGYGTF